jgi:hypothetical protein
VNWWVLAVVVVLTAACGGVSVPSGTTPTVGGSAATGPRAGGAVSGARPPAPDHIVIVVFENKDAGVPHNVSLHLGDVNGAELFKGEVFPGVATRVYDVPKLDAGSYAFVCTVHPTMIGTLTVK